MHIRWDGGYAYNTITGISLVGSAPISLAGSIVSKVMYGVSTLNYVDNLAGNNGQGYIQGQVANQQVHDYIGYGKTVIDLIGVGYSFVDYPNLSNPAIYLNTSTGIYSLYNDTTFPKLYNSYRNR